MVKTAKIVGVEMLGTRYPSMARNCILQHYCNPSICGGRAVTEPRYGRHMCAESELVCVVHCTRSQDMHGVHKRAAWTPWRWLPRCARRHDWPIGTGGVEMESTTRHTIGPGRVELRVEMRGWVLALNCTSC